MTNNTSTPTRVTITKSHNAAVLGFTHLGMTLRVNEGAEYEVVKEIGTVYHARPVAAPRKGSTVVIKRRFTAASK